MNPCVQDIIDKAAGKISEREAGKLLRDLTNKAKALAIEDGITLDEAAKRVIEESAKAEKMKAALSYRATMLNYRAMLNATDFVSNGLKSGRLMGQSLVDYLNQAYNNAHYQAGKVLNRMFSELEKSGVLREFNKGGEALSMDVFTERWQLSAGLPFATQNKVAQKIASIIVPIRKEMNAKMRLLGAAISDDQNYAGPQTHNPDILRRAGVPLGIKGALWGRENMNAAFDVWYAHVSSLNIDWSKTVAGTTESERKSFLKNFFESIYSGVHGGPVETIDPGRFLPAGGSLAERISSQRLLWFKDAKSQWEYNQRWGVKDFNTGIMSEIQNAHRQMAMLQHLGASPGNVFDNIVKKLRESVRNLPDSQAQRKSLEHGNIQGSYDLLAGKAGTTSHPWRSLFFSSVKDWVTASKGGGILFSMTGDPAFVNSEMALQGFSFADRISAPLKALSMLNTPEARKALQNMGFLAHAWTGQTAERWSNDVHPGRWTAKLSDWVFKWGGVTSVTDKERAVMTLMTSHRLGQEAGVSFDAMNPRTRALMERYQISPTEWDAARSTAYSVGDDLPVISPDRMQSLPDDVIDVMLKAENTTPTKSARDLKRLDLESKLGAYIHDRTLAGVPAPGLREREFMTGHATPKGEWSRELRDLFFIFKGFPITVAMRNKEAFGMLAQGEGRFSAFRHVAMLAAQSAVMGYVGLTARELLKGKEPRQLVENGQLNWKLFLESMQRGGGLGIYGDYLFNEYDTRTRGFLKSVAGPALGELETVANLVTKGRRSLYDERGDRIAESMGLDAARFAENNAPLLNLFYTKFFLDQFILWHIKEGLSPGVLRRTQKYDREQNWQEWWMDPVE